jgi:hypothetical protein
MPRFTRPGRRIDQPQQAVTIDRKNPLTAGLVAAITNVGSGLVDVIGNVYPSAFGTAPAPTSTPRGRGALATAGGLIFLGDKYAQTGAYTHFGLMNLSVIVNAYGGIFGGGRTDGNEQSQFVQRDGGNNGLAFYQSGADNPAVTSSGETLLLTDGRFHTLVLSGDGTAGGRAIYIDANSIAFGGGNSAPANSSPGRLVLYGERSADASAGASGAYLLHLVWNRQLSQSEIRALNLNPWQMFASPARKMLVAPAAAGASTTTATAAAGAATVSGVGASSAATVATSATGTATVSGTAQATAVTTATAAAGVATVSAVGAGVNVMAATAAAGVATVSGTAAATSKTLGQADGLAAVSGAAASLAATAGSAAGIATVSGAGASNAATTATPAAGTATVSAVGSSVAAGQTTAIPADGVATVSALASSVSAMIAVPAAGTSTVSATTPSTGPAQESQSYPGAQKKGREAKKYSYDYSSPRAPEVVAKPVKSSKVKAKKSIPDDVAEMLRLLESSQSVTAEVLAEQMAMRAAEMQRQAEEEDEIIAIIALAL